MSAKSSQHFLFRGELSDAPGRDESWDEYVRYLGNGRWKLIIEGSDFVGVATVLPVVELMSTKAIVNWVLERDAENDEVSDETEDDADSDPPRALGPRGQRLREIAVSENAGYCLTCLDGWLAGSWPPKKRQSSVRILEVKNLTRRGVWIRVYHTVYDIETNLGPAYMYPPDANHVAKIVMKSESSMSPGRLVNVPKEFWSTIESLKVASSST